MPTVLKQLAAAVWHRRRGQCTARPLSATAAKLSLIYSRMVERYRDSRNDKQKGGWRTVGGGAKAFIGPDGTIKAGCPGLKGEDVDEIGKDESPEHQDMREHRQDVATAKGLEGDELTHGEVKKLEEEPKPAEVPGEISADAVLERVKQSPNLADKEIDWNRYADRFGIEGRFVETQAPVSALVALSESGRLRMSNSIASNAVEEKAKSGKLNPIIITHEPGRQLLVVDGNHSLVAAYQRGDTTVPVVVAADYQSWLAPPSDQGKAYGYDYEVGRFYHDPKKRPAKPAPAAPTVVPAQQRPTPTLAAPATVTIGNKPYQVGKAGSQWFFRPAGNQQAGWVNASGETAKAIELELDPKAKQAAEMAARKRSLASQAGQATRAEKRKVFDDLIHEFNLDPQDLRDAASWLMGDKHREIAEREEAKNGARAATKLTAGRIAAWENAGKDYSTYPGLDEAARELARQYPGHFGRGYEGGTMADTEDNARLVWDAIREGKQPLPRLDDPSFLRDAAELAATRGVQSAEPEYTVENETFRRYGTVERYRKWRGSLAGQLQRLMYAKAAEGQRGLWDEDEHPRNETGEFTEKESGGPEAKEPELPKEQWPDEKKGPAGLTIAEAVSKAMAGSKRTIANYNQSVAATFAYTGTSEKDWKPVPVKGFASIEDAKGHKHEMPEFEFPEGYTKVKTPFAESSGGGEMVPCELCGATIKNVWWIQNDEKKWTLAVGSECVTHFGDNVSGEKAAKKSIAEANRQFVKDIRDVRNKLRTLGMYDQDENWLGRKVGTRRVWATHTEQGKKAKELNDRITAALTHQKYEVTHLESSTRGPVWTDRQIANWHKAKGNDAEKAYKDAKDFLGQSEPPAKFSLAHQLQRLLYARAGVLT